MLSAFAIHQPATISEASALLREYEGDAAIYAGGTELLVLMKERLVSFAHLIDIKHIPGLGGITLNDDGGSIAIGALASHRSIETSPLIRERAPLLAEVESQVANIRVRNAGTIGGNLCFAEPHSDPATLLVAWDAEFTLESSAGSRTVAAGDFFTGLLETVREPDELLTNIVIPAPSIGASVHRGHAERSEASPAAAGRLLQRRDESEREILRFAQNDRLSGAGSAYQRFKTHERPTAAVAVTLDIENGAIHDARVVAGSVGAGPERLTTIEAALAGQRPEGELFDVCSVQAAGVVSIEEEGFESSDYKRHLIAVLTSRALTQAAERAAS